MPDHARVVEWLIGMRGGFGPANRANNKRYSVRMTDLVFLCSQERYRMKQFVADLMYQILVELLSQIVLRLAEWLSAATWL